MLLDIEDRDFDQSREVFCVEV